MNEQINLTNEQINLTNEQINLINQAIHFTNEYYEEQRHNVNIMLNLILRYNLIEWITNFNPMNRFDAHVGNNYWLLRDNIHNMDNATFERCLHVCRHALTRIV